LHHLLALSLLSSQPQSVEHRLFDLPALRCWDDDALESAWWRPPPRFDPVLLDACLLGVGRAAPWPPAILKPDPPPRTTPRGHWREVLVSWYGQSDSKYTATGALYDADGISCAHRSLPIGTRVRFWCKANGLIKTAKVKDRGPYIYIRTFDLSKGLARALHLLGPSQPANIPLMVQVLR
jgi:hypothetical protein